MLVNLVTQILSLTPRGLSSDQLLGRIRGGGLRPSAGEIAETLAFLSDSGVIATAAGRWRLAEVRRNAASPGTVGGTASPVVSSPGTRLRAIALGALPPRQGGADAPSPDDEAADSEPRADADWNKLLAYYAATQRLDPRGVVDERIDRHGQSWHLIRANGSWWQAEAMECPADALPPSFREALSRRSGSSCSLGYPIGVFESEGGGDIVPALLLAASFCFTGTKFRVEIADSAPVANPRWLELAARQLKGRRKEQLLEALFPEGEEDQFLEVVRRLANSAATLARAPLQPGQLDVELETGEAGHHNLAALFLPTSASFTQGAERDLEAMAAWPEEKLRKTALWSLLGPDGAGVEPVGQSPAPCGPRPLTHGQYNAAAAALTRPVSVIQGPPGTGKSEVILTLLSSIVLAGGSALLVSKNHRALDEVEQRLRPLAGEAPLLIRARDADGERDVKFEDALQLLAVGETQDALEAGEESVAGLREKSDRLLAAHQARADWIALNLQLCEVVDRLGRWEDEGPARTEREAGWRARLTVWLGSLWRRRSTEGGTDYATLVRSERDLRRGVETTSEIDADNIETLAALVAQEFPEVMERWARHITRPSQEERKILVDCRQALQFARNGQMPEAASRLMLRHRPIWAVSTLSAPARVPLIPALFDYVIFDEASQCDIASALPLMARARRAVVVGDPMQLRFIPQLSLNQEHALMDAAGLGKAGRHIVAQSANSLFDFVDRRPRVDRHFLSDQFRSDPEIVSYLNTEFYEGRLVAAQTRNRPPNGFKPGLAWHDIDGRTTREEGGNVNHAEAEAVVKLVITMIRDRSFDGSIGVISPFNAQVGLLMRRIKDSLSEAERSKVFVSTIDKAQGGEADVILFSVVVGPGAERGALTFYSRERRRLNVAISRARALCLVVGNRNYAGSCGVPTLERLARSSEHKPRPRDGFDSEWERRLDKALRQHGLEPFPQYPVGSRFLDLALDPGGKKIDVEVDGRRWHTDADGNRKVADLLRDRQMIALGWTVRRFWVHELAKDMESCVERIKRDLQ